MPPRASTLLRGCAATVAVVSTVLLAVLLLHLCSSPIYTNDAWWHLAMGKVYAAHGPWISTDPFLHTALESGPVPHEWLFGVALHGLERIAGLDGVRIAHLLWVLLVLGIAWSLFRHESPSLAATAAATAAFVALSWWRLIQLRPDLFSIAATLAVYRILLEPEAPPSWGRVAAVSALLLVWANVHSLFALGLLLPLAALFGIAARRLLLWRWMGSEQDSLRIEEARFRRLGTALVCGVAVTLVNPRGIAQHLTFLSSSRETAIWEVVDEWTHFRLLWHTYDGFLRSGAINLASWLTAGLVMSCFVGAILLGGVRLWRRPTRPNLQAADPVLAAVGGASLVAALVSIRFLWMLVFPLLFVLRAWRIGVEGRRSWDAPAALLAASAAVILAVAVPRVEFFRALARHAPRSVDEFHDRPYSKNKFHADAVAFLEEAEIRGNLFNYYAMGGFLEYRVGTRLKTFIDGRTEHYPPEVLRDHGSILQMRGSFPHEGFLDLLERRKIDVFLGTGRPGNHPQHPSTTTHLENAPGWTMVWRSWQDAVYLSSEDRGNLEAAASWYRGEGVPFDPEHGLEIAAVLRTRPEWAESRGIAPPGFSAAWKRRAASEPDVRFAALEVLGWTYAATGAYAEQVGVEREALRLRPEARAPRRRLVYALLRLGRGPEAIRTAVELVQLDPSDGRSQVAQDIATRYVRGRAGGPYPALALLSSFPLGAPPATRMASAR